MFPFGSDTGNRFPNCDIQTGGLARPKPPVFSDA